jgi:hypothetical protein
MMNRDQNRDQNIDQMKNIVSGVLVVDKPVGLTSTMWFRSSGVERNPAGRACRYARPHLGVLVVLIGPAVVGEYVSAPIALPGDHPPGQLYRYV